MTTPASGVIVGGSMATLYGVITQSAGREVVSATINAGSLVPLVINNASWSVTIPLPAGDETMRPFVVTALDATGQSSTFTFSLDLDTLAPRATVTRPDAGAVVGSSPLIEGQVADRSSVTTLTVNAGSGALSASLDGGGWARIVSFAPNLDRVTRTLTIDTSDSFGNQATTTAQVLVDTQGPRLSLTSPDAGVAVGSPVALSGTAADSTSPVSNFTVDFGTGAQPVTVASNGTWTTMATFDAGLDRVSRSVLLQGQDSLGNQTQVMAQVLVDTQGPVLSLRSPDAGVAVSSPVALSGTAVDSTSAVSNFTVDFGTGAQPVTVTGGGGWTTSATFPAGLDRVSRSITLRGQDALGNTTQTTAQVLVDTQGPVLSLRTPDAGVAVGASAVLSGTATDSTGPVSGFTVDVGSGAQPVTVSANSWTTTVTFPAGLDRVSRTVTLRGQDALGNVTQTTAQVLVDTAGPVLALRSPDAGVAVTSPATLSGTAVDSSGPVSGFSVDVGNGLQSVAVSSGAWTTSVTFPLNLDRVARNVTLRGQDPLGNTTQTTVQVLVDTLPPAFLVTWTAPVARAAIAGGADFRDPTEIAGGPALFRRHDVPTITVQAPASDVNAGSVLLSVGSVSVQAQTGVNCSADGGFCRAVSFDLAQPELPSLRGNLGVGVAGADVRGNTSATDAGTLTVSRWYSAFDGGSQFNFFSVSETGEVVVPNAATSRVTVLSSTGAPLANFVAQGQPLGAAAVGQVRISGSRYIYVLELGASSMTVGEAMPLDRPSDPIVGWASSAVRTGLYGAPILRTDPGTSSEEVANIYVMSDSFGGWKAAADWRSLVTGQSGTRITATPVQGLQNAISSVAAVGGRFVATDGVKLFGFRGSSSNLAFLEEIGVPYTLTPGTFTQVGQLAATSSTEVGGVVSSPGAYGFFSSLLPTTFTPSAVSTSEFINYTLHKQGTAFFALRTAATNLDRVCSATLTSTSFTCLNDVNGVVFRLALGANDTLYLLVARGGDRVLQVRTASTLALRWETVLPVACELSLVPTCLQGKPVIGCLDTQARILFLETDARGIDVTAEWPMLGHDPGLTFNTSTPLTGYACP